MDEEDIAGVVSRWTGIPVSKLLEGEMQKLLHLEDELHKRVIGQDEAVTAVAEAVMRARVRAEGPATGRSAASFSWGRPAWARPNWRGRWPQFLFDDERAMVRIDMRSTWRSTRWRG